jgi:hypothetical protein
MTRTRLDLTPYQTPTGPSTAEFSGEHRGMHVELWERGFMWAWAIFALDQFTPVDQGASLLRSDAEHNAAQHIDQYLARKERES